VTAAKAALAQASPAATAALANLKITYSSSARAKTRLEWFQGQWKTNLGLNVALDPVDATTYSALVKKPETTPALFFLGWCADYPDPQNWLSMVFHSNSTVSRVGYNNPQFDKLTEDADKEADATKRADLYQQASRILSQDAGAAFVYNDANPALLKPWVKDYHLTTLQHETQRFIDAYVTKKS
jgi:oligopeptide transport system substrate-binding protein